MGEATDSARFDINRACPSEVTETGQGDEEEEDEELPLKAEDDGEEEDEFAECDLPTYAKSYVLSRVTQRDKEDRSRKTASESRMSRTLSPSPLKRSVDDEFKLSMIKASLDYDLGNHRGKFEADWRARNTSKVLPGQEWAVDRVALEKAK